MSILNYPSDDESIDYSDMLEFVDFNHEEVKSYPRDKKIDVAKKL